MTDAASAAIKSGYRWELDRDIRTNNYMRVFFSTAVLGYCSFGPGLPELDVRAISDRHLLVAGRKGS